MNTPLYQTTIQTHAEAHEHFKATQMQVCYHQEKWEEAQGRYERAAVSQGLDGALTQRAFEYLLTAYEQHARARAAHEIARHILWEAAKVAQLDHDLAQTR